VITATSSFNVILWEKWPKCLSENNIRINATPPADCTWNISFHAVDSEDASRVKRITSRKYWGTTVHEIHTRGRADRNEVSWHWKTQQWHWASSLTEHCRIFSSVSVLRRS